MSELAPPELAELTGFDGPTEADEALLLVAGAAAVVDEPAVVDDEAVGLFEDEQPAARTVIPTAASARTRRCADIAEPFLISRSSEPANGTGGTTVLVLRGVGTIGGTRRPKFCQECSQLQRDKTVHANIGKVKPCRDIDCDRFLAVIFGIPRIGAKPARIRRLGMTN